MSPPFGDPHINKTFSSLWHRAAAGHPTVDFIVEIGLASSRHLVAPHRHPGIQHHVVTVSPFVGAVHGSLVPVALDRACLGDHLLRLVNAMDVAAWQ